jgi:O-antigen/teichoic acid export membrane protein
MLKKEFIRNYSIYFTGAMIVALVNYLFYPILARFMTLEGFGEVQVLISLFTEFSVITGVLSIVVLHIVATPGDAEEKSHTITELRKLVWIGAAILSAAIAICSFPMAKFFHFSSPTPFVALAALLFLSVLPLFANAYLQGKLLYFKTSVSSFIGSAGRIAGAVIMILLGFGVVGAILGVAIAQLLIWAYASYQTRHAPELKSSRLAGIESVEKPPIARELRYAGLVFVTNISTTILYTADILIVEHYFDPATAGLYAGISAVAKIGYFALSPLGAVILPSVARDISARHHSLKTAMIVFFALAIPGVLLSYWFYGLIVSVLFGARYVPFSNLLPLAIVLMVAVAFVQVLSSYFLALRRAALFSIMPSAVVVAIGLCVIFHASVPAILIDMLIGTTVAIFGLIILYAKEYLNRYTDS